jgi:transposase
VTARRTDVAARFGVRRQTVHEWLAKYEGGGLDALVDRSHRPRSCPHQMGSAAEVAVLELRRAHPSWGPRRLRFELVKRELGPVPSESAIYRCLVRHGQIAPDGRRARAEHWRRTGAEPEPSIGAGGSGGDPTSGQGTGGVPQLWSLRWWPC